MRKRKLANWLLIFWLTKMTSYNLSHALYELAAKQPDSMAIALPTKPGKPLPENGPIPYHIINFKSLANETNCISQGLLAFGFKPGDRVILMVPQGLDFFTLCFACLQSGIIPVLIDPGIGTRYLKKCIDESEPSGFIGIPKAHVARIVLGWGKKTIKKKITIGRKLFWGGALFRDMKKAASSDVLPVFFNAQTDDLAAILFTSGSTGVPKGVMYTNGNFYHQVRIIRNTFNARPGEIDLPTFPPFALFNPAAGMSTVIPDMDPTRPAHVDPEKIIRVIQQFEITSMFGSPVLIDRVGRYGEAKKIKLPTLKRVFSAGAPVPSKVLKRFSTMLNDSTQIFTPYGATEAMPVASICSHQILKDDFQQRTNNGGGICIGKPVETVQVKIIRITDEPIETWSEDLEVSISVVGEIVVKGKNVTRAYFNRDMATKLAKIIDGDSFWHRMGDLAYKDAEGNLWFCGRKTHRIQLPGKELYSVQCESVFNKHPQVYRTALVGVDNQAVLCVELDKDIINPDKEQIGKELLEWAHGNELTRDIQKVLFHQSFPVDIRHNAKIFREKLAVWAAQRLSGHHNRRVISIFV
jgi:acyl-CoA synthetase (AMP-forming)/AMP-acid ligase II